MMQVLQVQSVVDNLMSMVINKKLPNQTMVDLISHYRPIYVERIKSKV